MEHEHTQHVAAPPDRVFAALADVNNLPRYVPQLTAARRTDGDTVAMRELAKAVREEERLTPALLPVGTGLLAGVVR